MGASAISADMKDLRVLRRAKRALEGIDVRAIVPQLTWRVSGEGDLDRAAGLAAIAVIRGQWTRNQFRNAAVAALQAKIDAITGKYPGLNTED